MREGVTSVEVIILGSLLKRPALVFEVASKITPEMFSTEAHSVIYRKILSLSEDNFVPNKNLLINFLQSAGLLALVGTESYINYLEEFVQEEDIDNIEKYLTILNKSFKARELLKISNYVDELNSGIAVDVVDGVLESVVSRIEFIQEKGTQVSTAKISVFLPDAWQRLRDKVTNPGLTGVTTGFTSLDAITGGYNPGDYWIVAGRPSHGKTAVVLNSMLKSAVEGNASLLFSLEMNEQQLIERLVSLITGVDHLKLRLGTLSENEVVLVGEGFKTLKELPIYISTIYDLNSAEIKHTITKYVKLYGIEIVWIDYIQLTTERENNATHTIGSISRMCKLLARKLDIFIGVVSQLSRAVEQRDNKRPVKADLRQSGNLEEDADLIIFCYRDEIYNAESKDNKDKLELIIDKNRNGPIGLIPMKFNKELMRVYDK